MTASITDDGVAFETLGENREVLVAAFEAAFPPQGTQVLNTSPDFYTGREINIMAEQFVALQNLLAQFVDALDPTQATGAWVDFHLALQGTRRKPATKSTIDGIVYGTPGTDVGDKRVKYLPNESIWRTPAGLLIGPTGATSTVLTADEGGPTSALNTGTASWLIVDVTAGWEAVESAGDVNLGTSVESDSEGRARVSRTAAGIGEGTLPALLKALWEVPGVVDVGINNNRTLLPDSEGVPGKSVEAVVDGGSDEDVATAIASTINGTAGFFGSTTFVVTLEVILTDGSVVTKDVSVRFTRVALIDIIAQYTISFGVAVNAPANAEDLAKQTAADYINNAGRGVDVVPTASAAAVTNALPPASEPVVSALVAIKGNPLAAVTIVIGSRQRARINPEAQPAFVLATNVEPYNFDVSWNLDIEVDGIFYNITFASTDFEVVSAATALEIANVINLQAPTATASVQDGALMIETQTAGAESELSITPTTSAGLLAIVGLSVGTENGTDGDITVVFV